MTDVQKSNLQQFLKEGSRADYGQHPILGWVATADANAAGMRDDREYELTAPAGKIRISAFGDSFVYGSGVKLPDSWLKQLASLDPSLEVLNYGVGAYGLDQAYLRYQLVGTDYRPHIVIIGYMSENLARNVNIFRAFYTPWYRDVIFTKPRFELRGNMLSLIKNPIATREDHERLLMNDAEVLRQLGQHDYHYQISYRAGPFDVLPTVRFAKIAWYYLHRSLAKPIFTIGGEYNVEAEAFKVTVGILEAFYREVLENGALPVIVVLPDTNDQQRSRANRNRRYGPLLEVLRQRGYAYIDILEAFEPEASRYSIDDLTVTWGHFSPLGGRIAAQYLLTKLRAMGCLNIDQVHGLILGEQRRLRISPRLNHASTSK